MKKVIILNKKEGDTPLETQEFFRSKHPVYSMVPMTYAGRLDPMASGLLIILAGEEVKNKEKYLALEKEYEFEVLFGFSTDTYDILGKVSPRQGLGGRADIKKKKLEKEIKNNLKSFIGESVQKYPMYSSKTVKGKPLFTYARSGKEVEIPERKIFIKSLKFQKIKEVNNKKLFQDIERRVKKVKGDFRQDDILKTWQKTLLQDQVSAKGKEYFYIGNFKIKCSSGTYVRVVADLFGKKIGIPALAYSIKRTKVGKYVTL